jgi:hypothetical protein
MIAMRPRMISGPAAATRKPPDTQRTTAIQIADSTNH